MSAITDTLWHRATVTPMVAGDATGYRQKGYAGGEPSEGVHCRFRLATAQEVDLFMPAGTQRTTYVVSFADAVAVNQRDKIGPIRDTKSVIILNKTLTVQSIQTRRLLDEPLIKMCYCVEMG